MPPCRTLKFQSLAEAVADAEALLQGGYEQCGQWNLAQVLGHCSDWLRFPVEGYPRVGFPVNLILGTVRWIWGPSLRGKVVREGGFKAGSATMPVTVKAADATTDQAAWVAFAAAVDQFERHRGPLHASPLFGAMTHEEHRQLQIIHVQHHLSHLRPLSGGNQP